MYRTSPLATNRQRISVWKKAQKVWKNRKQNPLTELRKMRAEWK
ncbi:MAG: hypothetical protein UY07_C0011G0009 [Parcubacteria group bacterium GW2011_GWA1_47_8]|nr:MAG: hypothetical protein UY07_C0011G0009 [Parcubacteria group bacterium GW2011_GWA1_47_8]